MSKDRANPSKGKHYNKEFKLSEVKMVLEEHLEAADVAIRLGVPVDMLKRSVNTQVKRSTSKEQQSMKELIVQNKKQEEEIRRLKMEREILKKAMAYFMPEKSEHNCKFLSLRDNFDSTTPAGEMITLANFAQFERRQTSERIANSFQARSKRGLWNGGVLPLGYEVDELKPGHLKIVFEEAEIVREVFKTFLSEETIAQTAKSLNDRNIKLPRKMRGSGRYRSSHFKIDNTHGILKNKAYIGVRVYKTKEGTKEVKAVWENIIDPIQFDRVQKILEKNYMRKKPSTCSRYPYTLSEILFCKTCGDRLCGKSAHGKKEKIAYYEHAWSTKNQGIRHTKHYLKGSSEYEDSCLTWGVRHIKRYFKG